DRSAPLLRLRDPLLRGAPPRPPRAPDRAALLPAPDPRLRCPARRDPLEPHLRDPADGRAAGLLRAVEGRSAGALAAIELGDHGAADQLERAHPLRVRDVVGVREAEEEIAARRLVGAGDLDAAVGIADHRRARVADEVEADRLEPAGLGDPLDAVQVE